MAKFSIWRDNEEEEDNEEEDFCIRSPKRRRTSHHPPSTAESNSYDPFNDQQQRRSCDLVNDDVVVGDDESDATGQTDNSGGPMSVILSDPDVLDCAICFEPLTIPVFQCDNGHVACSSCCSNLGNKCPSCSGKIGNNRCRAIEKVVESIRVSCCYKRYGCRETVSYSKKHEHEDNCICAPCLCPFPNCLFRGSPKKLSRHLCEEHSGLVTRFRYNSIFSVSVGTDENFYVLQEERDGVLFILSHGNTVAIRCIDPNLSKGGFAYDLVLRGGGSSLKFQSFTHCTTGQLSDPPSMDYVLVPSYFYRTGAGLKLEICIRSNGTSHVDSARVHDI